MATGETEINVETNMQEREKERRMKSWECERGMKQEKRIECQSCKRNVWEREWVRRCVPRWKSKWDIYVLRNVELCAILDTEREREREREREKTPLCKCES